jgi:alpha-galactosidase
MRALLIIAATSVCLFAGFRIALATGQLTAASVDASVQCDLSRKSCVISNASVQLQLDVRVSAAARVSRLTVPRTGQTFVIADGADALLTLDDRVLHVGAQADGFVVSDVRAAAVTNGVTLEVDMLLADAHATITRHYALYDGSPTFELWTTVRPDSHPVSLSDLNAFSLTIPDGSIQYINGLQGDNSIVERDGVFSLQRRLLNDGETLSLGSLERSSQETIPWMVVDGGGQSVFAGVMWSGAWSMSATKAGGTIALVGGLAPMSTVATPESPVDGPHGFFGVVAGGVDAVAPAVQAFIVGGVRRGRGFAPFVTYNTWFAYGTRMDEASILSEMISASALGSELFVVDAGWYSGSGANGIFDFDSGLGSWQADPDRFPNGLKLLADQAHGLGMKFGIWLEPERVDLAKVGPGGVEESWLATAQGSYGSDRAAQVCLAGTRARAWIFEHLTSLIDQVHPDYLKWDNNMWINCDRDGHGHGEADGNFAHVRGLYDLLDALRARYPDLILENVSGGGNRLDVGMLRYTDVGWMDDRTAPSVHVRHNVEGLSTLFPPAYLLSFAVPHDTEPLQRAPDLRLYLRSRMQGVLGLSLLTGRLYDDDAASLAREVSVYKSFRDALSNASATLLTDQALVVDGPAWDVLEASDPESGAVILSAFQIDAGTTQINVKPRDLAPSSIYTVRSVDQGMLGSASGEALMRDGIDIVASQLTAAHVLLLSPDAAAGTTAARLRGKARR